MRKRGFRRVAAIVGAVMVMGAGGAAASPVASAAEADSSTGVYFCPEGWYGVIVGIQTPTRERYIIACVQA